MSANAMLFSVGLFAGGAAVYFFLGQAPEPAPPVPEPAATVQTQAAQDDPEPPPGPNPLQSQLDEALAEIAALREQLAALRVEIEAKNGQYGALEREVSALREQLAAEHEARRALESVPLDPQVAAANDPPPSEPPASEPAGEAPAAVAESRDDPEPEAPVDPPRETVSGTGTFVLKEGDAWIGDTEADVFRVLSVVQADGTKIERAEVDAFGNRGVVEQATQVSHAMESGHYTLIVTRVNARTGAVELLVERER